MDNTENYAKWMASLSNGETITEGKGIAVADEKTPAWHKFLKYLEENNLTITGMQIRSNKRVFHLPSMSGYRFNSEIPISYKAYRIARGVVMGDKSKVRETYLVIEAEYPDLKLQLAVDQNNYRNCWTAIERINKVSK